MPTPIERALEYLSQGFTDWAAGEGHQGEGDLTHEDAQESFLSWLPRKLMGGPDRTLDERAAAAAQKATSLGPVTPMQQARERNAWEAERFSEANAMQGSIEAWHGSPFKFSRFKTRGTIGRGEGGAAYGHGLYFAENPEVARSYHKQLAIPGQVHIDGAPLASPNVVGNDVFTAAHLIADLGYEGALDQARTLLHDAPHLFTKAGVAGQRRVIAAIEGLKGRTITTKPSGALYQVQLHVDPEQLLDWDAPLSEQGPGVQQALRDLNLPQLQTRVVPREGGYQIMHGDTPVGVPYNREEDALSRVQHGFRLSSGEEVPGATGGHAYFGLAGRDRQGYMSGRNWLASKKLQNVGVPGHRYLDQGSRAAGEGTRNVVMYPGSENLIEILKTYGVPAAVLAGLAHALGQDEPATTTQ